VHKETGKGPAMVKTLAYTMAVIMASSITSILKIQNRATKIGTMTPLENPPAGGCTHGKLHAPSRAFY